MKPPLGSPEVYTNPSGLPFIPTSDLLFGVWQVHTDDHAVMGVLLRVQCTRKASTPELVGPASVGNQETPNRRNAQEPFSSCGQKPAGDFFETNTAALATSRSWRRSVRTEGWAGGAAASFRMPGN